MNVRICNEFSNRYFDRTARSNSYKRSWDDDGTPYAIFNNYWFTSSTSFANPAVTLARAASNTFAGIRPADAPGFIIAQLLGAAAATLLFCWLYPAPPQEATVGGTVAPSDFAGQQNS